MIVFPFTGNHPASLKTLPETMASKSKEKFLKLIHGFCRLEANNMNIIEGIIFVICEYYQIAAWSNEFKGEFIKLSDDDSKATCTKETDYGQSIRADFCINRGQIVSWALDCHRFYLDGCYFYGVISSKQQKFDGSPGWEQIKDAYGVDDTTDTIYLGNNQVHLKHTSKDKDGVNMAWSKPKFPQDFKLEMTADWTEKQCKLSIFYEGKKLNDTNDQYTLLLPELDDECVWYPCATPFNEGAYCIIRYA